MSHSPEYVCLQLSSGTPSAQNRRAILCEERCACHSGLAWLRARSWPAPLRSVSMTFPPAGLQFG
jgi:hypothetical protein